MLLPTPAAIDVARAAPVAVGVFDTDTDDRTAVSIDPPSDLIVLGVDDVAHVGIASAWRAAVLPGARETTVRIVGVVAKDQQLTTDFVVVAGVPAAFIGVDGPA